MQALLFARNAWTTQISFAYRKKNKYYASRPELFTRISTFKKKINFRSPQLVFPINVPLKFRYIYRPQKHMVRKAQMEDFLDFSVMSGNEILLYLEQVANLRNSEITDALKELIKRNETRKLPLHTHPWVLNAANEGLRRMNHFLRSEYVSFIWSLRSLDIPTDWAVHEARSRMFLPNMKASDFAKVYQIFFEKSERSSPEFRKELSLLLPVHLRQMSPSGIVACFALTYQNNLMTEYLFEDHMHQVFWKRLKWFIIQNQFAPMLRLFREANYEHDEFLWPDLYKLLKEEAERIPLEKCQPIRDELVLVKEAFSSHEQYGIADIIKHLSTRVTWEETLGGQARKLTLVEMVKNDLLYYKEQQKLKRQ